MENQVLSVEQMKELKALHVNTYDASMIWEYIDSFNDRDYYRLKILNYDKDAITKNDVPTFTLQDILDILPRHIILDGTKTLTIKPPYCIEYRSFTDIGHTIVKETLIDAAFAMLKWCKENKYI